MEFQSAAVVCDVCGANPARCQCEPWQPRAVLRDLTNQQPPDSFTTKAERYAFMAGLNYAIGMVRLILPKGER